eukprot:2644494-Alexandrium_andersonii.AAC.1
MDAAAQETRKLASAALPRALMRRVPAGEIFPMGLYGAPAAAVARGKIKHFRSAIASCLGKGAAPNRAPELACAVAGPNVDPDLRVFQDRAAALRKAWRTGGRQRERLVRVFAMLRMSGHAGLQRGEGE